MIKFWVTLLKNTEDKKLEGINIYFRHTTSGGQIWAWSVTKLNILSRKMEQFWGEGSNYIVFLSIFINFHWFFILNQVLK